MLIRFEVENFRSILRAAELSMVSVDESRPGSRYQAALSHSVVPLAAVYGPNASGKSNIVGALHWLLAGVRDSLRFWDDGIPIEPFAFGEEARGARSRFEIEYLVKGVRFEYILELDWDSISYEALFHYPEKRRRRVFEREGEDLTLQRRLGALAGTRELLTRRSLVLSIARRFDEPLVSDFANEMLKAQSVGVREPENRRVSLRKRSSSWPFFGRQGSASGGVEPPDEVLIPRERAVEMLRLADLGVEDVVLDSEKNTPRLVHRTAGPPVSLDLREESQGTRTWFGLVVPLLRALGDGSLFLFDELDASLHPTLTAQLLGLFSAADSNPSGAQLVFTSHDTSLLDHLDRDEVWLTEKDDGGATSLTALAEFDSDRVQRSVELERGYLGGRFGAIPDIDRSRLLRALGLTG